MCPRVSRGSRSLKSPRKSPGTHQYLGYFCNHMKGISSEDNDSDYNDEEGYCAVKKAFSKNCVRERWKTIQKSKKSQNYSKTSKRFQLLPNAPQCIPLVRMGPNTSESLKKNANTSKNIAKTSRKTSRNVLSKRFTRSNRMFGKDVKEFEL